jgi:hypothetical protein
MPISNKDKARITLAKKRIEANKEAALLPWVAKKPIGYKALALGQEKETPSYPNKAIVQAAQGMVSPENKTFAQMRLGGVNRFEGVAGEYDHPSHIIKGNTSGRNSRKK